MNLTNAASVSSGNSQFQSSTRRSDWKRAFERISFVEGKVIIELKSVEIISPLHKKQLLTYLRLADKRLGLLINFNVSLIKDGISRVVNALPE
jgi:GxxExxY protein